MSAGAVLAVLSALCVALMSGGRAGAAVSTTLFTITDHRIDEASGIARGVVSPGVFYVQNDSGDSARFFAVDASTGRVRAEYDVPGATNVDWEDLAVAPDRSGRSSVWLADIGDNDAVRDSVTLYRVPEPRVDMNRYGLVRETARAHVSRLRYPGGAVDAESLAVTPRGQAFVVTKVASGRSVFYAVPDVPEGGRTRTVRAVGTHRFRAGASLFPDKYQVLATGASISPDGSLLAVRTYSAAYLWRLSFGDTVNGVRRALRARPVEVDLPLQLQGEGICFDDDRLVLDSEMLPSPVVSVALPAGFRATGTGTRATSETPPPTASTTAPTRSTTSPSGAPTRPVGAARGEPFSLGWRIVVAVVVFGLVVLLFVRRVRARRARRGRE